MKKNLVLAALMGLTLGACTHRPPAAEEKTDYRNPANTGDVGSVNDRSLSVLNQELAKSYMQVAARISQARAKGLNCEGNFYHQSIFSAFQNAILSDFNVEVDDSVKSQMGSSFTYKSYLIQKNTGLLNQEDLLKRVNFDGVSWRSMAQGAFGTGIILTQKSGGVLEVQEFNMDKMVWEKRQGQWKIGLYEAKRRSSGSYRAPVSVLFFTYSGKTRAYEIIPVPEGGNALVPYKSNNSYFQKINSLQFTDYINGECDA